MAQFDAKNLRNIGIMTSGGDAPGMNAAVRALVRCCGAEKLSAIGIIGGYSGLLKGQFQSLDMRSVANILQRGGTLLKSGRCPEFMRPENRKIAIKNLREQAIDALVVVGGDGSFHGAQVLWNEHQFPVVGLPGTIDNDIFGTDQSIGYDTAVNTALDAIDRIRDTAASHDRLFIVEVMGRDSGYIAIDVGLAGGAEEIFIPENPITVDEAIAQIQRGISRGKTSSILIAAEGQKPGRAYDLAEQIRKKAGYEAKVCILGHIQRGGAPTAVDRILASRLGAAAVKVLRSGQCDAMIGVQAGQVVMVPFEVCFKNKKRVPKDLIDLAKILSN